MKNIGKQFCKQHGRMKGFTMVELAVVMAVVMIIMGMALPYFMQAYRLYELNDTATKVASLVKFTRYEAIRRNTPISARLLQTSSSPVVEIFWTDSNGDTLVQDTETQILLSGNVNLVSAGTVPGTAALATAVGAGTLTSPSISSSSIQFDERGAVNPAAVNVLYVGNSAFPNLGNRAIILLPSGSVQTWTGDATGNWRQAN